MSAKQSLNHNLSKTGWSWGLRLSDWFQWANDLCCRRASWRREAFRCARGWKADGFSGTWIGDTVRQWLFRPTRAVKLGHIEGADPFVCSRRQMRRPCPLSRTDKSSQSPWFPFQGFALFIATAGTREAGTERQLHSVDARRDKTRDDEF